MPDVYGPFDTGSFLQSQWYRDRGYLEPSGVQGTALATPNPATGDLALTTAGLTSSLALGRAHVRGAAYERTGTAWTYAHPANTDPVNARIDRVVLRRDLTAKTVVPAVLQGTPAASPAVPTLTQVDTGIWEIGLFQVTVPANSGTTLFVVDERYWLGPNGGGGIPLGQFVPGSFVGQYRDHPVNGLERWDGTRWTTPQPVGQWTTPTGLDGTSTTYSFTNPTGAYGTATSGSFAVTVPAGRQLEVAFRGRLNVTATADTRLTFDVNGTKYSTTQFAVAGTQPVAVDAVIPGTGVQLTVAVQGQNAGTGTSTIAASGLAGGGPVLRYRLL